MHDVLAITLRAMQHDMAAVERIASNLANQRTTAFKRDLPAAATFAARIDAAQPPPAIDMRPGTLSPTGRPLDVALAGPGWFEVQTANGVAHTRQGEFRRDAQGRLVTPQGHLVLGVGGPIQLEPVDVAIDAQGAIRHAPGAGARPGDPPLAQLKVVQFDPASGARRLGDGLLAFAGEARALSGAEVQVRQGYLENANVDPMQEMVQLVRTVRHFEGLQKVAAGLDELTGNAIRRLGENH